MNDKNQTGSRPGCRCSTVLFRRPGIRGGRNPHQLRVQIEGCLVSLAYSAIMTLVLLVIVDKLFGFRLSGAEEKAGWDHSLHRERGYGMLTLNL